MCETAPETLRSETTIDSDWMASVMISYAPESEDECEPMTVRAPYTMAVLSAEMGAAK